MQAVDRAHRIGQQNPVNVHRILIEETVEDRIIELQNRKRKIVEAALDEKASQGLGRLGVRELIYLFGADRDAQPARQAFPPQPSAPGLPPAGGDSGPGRLVYPPRSPAAGPAVAAAPFRQPSIEFSSGDEYD